nr:unnamed protein product [Callosobruchus chinensis]
MTTVMTAIEFLNLARKILPHEYDGSPDRLQSFLKGHTLLTAYATGNEQNAIAYIKTRLCGKARGLIGDNDSLQDIAQKLRQGIKTESSQAVTSKILGHKQFQKDKTKYAEEIETLSAKLKRAYISEGVPAAVAETYCTNTVVRALSTNASSDRAKLIMEAGTFNSTQEAITKFVGISIDNNANDQTILYTTRQNNRTFFRHSFRGRGDNYHGQNRRFQHDGHYNNVNTQPQHRSFNNRGNHTIYRGNHRGRSFGGYRSHRGNNQRFVRTYEADLGIQGNDESPQPGPLGSP